MSINEYIKNKEIKTFPHHKHLKSGKIIESHAVELTDVLEEIERMILKNLW